MANLIAGTTVYLLRGSKYAGAWELAEVGPADANGWQNIKTVDHGPLTVREWFTRAEDAFATEAEARQAARDRRAPRRQRMTPYGDYGQLAALLRKNR